jgi:hypothetical protein
MKKQVVTARPNDELLMCGHPSRNCPEIVGRLSWDGHDVAIDLTVQQCPRDFLYQRAPSTEQLWAFWAAADERANQWYPDGVADPPPTGDRYPRASKPKMYQK